MRNAFSTAFRARRAIWGLGWWLTVCPAAGQTQSKPPQRQTVAPSPPCSTTVSAAQLESVMTASLRQIEAGNASEALKLLHSLNESCGLPASYFHLRGSVEARSGQLQPAERSLEQALALDPHIADAWFLLGLLKLQRGSVEEARELLAKSVASNPRRAEAWLALGQAQLRGERPRAAEESFRQAVSTSNGSPQILFGLGKAYEEAGDFERAAAAYERVVAGGESAEAPKLAWVRAMIAAGQAGKLAGHLEKWRDDKATSAALHNEIGILLADAGLYPQALQQFQAARKRDPERADIEYNLAQSLFHARSYEQAETIAKELVANKSDAQGRYLLGSIYEETGRFEAAAQEFARAAALGPRAAGPQIGLGRVALAAGGDYPAAQEHFSRARSLCEATDCTIALLGLGTSLKLQSKFEEAEAAFREAAGRSGDQPLPYLYLADSLIRARKFSEALAPLQRALELQPDSSLGHYMYAYALLQGEPQGTPEALAHLRETIRLDPNHGFAHYRLGMISNRQGEPAEAARLLEKAVELLPDFKQARAQLVMSYRKLGKEEAARQQAEQLRALDRTVMEEEQEVLGRFNQVPASAHDGPAKPAAPNQ